MKLLYAFCLLISLAPLQAADKRLLPPTDPEAGLTLQNDAETMRRGQPVGGQYPPASACICDCKREYCATYCQENCCNRRAWRGSCKVLATACCCAGCIVAVAAAMIYGWGLQK